MPNKTPKICAAGACQEKTLTKYCKFHSQYEKAVKRQYERQRPSAHQRGYTLKWQRYSRYRLKKWPLCEICLSKGRTTSAILTDHITPHKGNMDLFWNPANHQSACARCHNQKTASEEGGFGNPIKN